MRRLLVASFALIISGCSDGDLNRLEAFAGIAFPRNIELTFKEDNWASPNGEGHSLRVYKMPAGTSWIAGNRCELSGFRKGRVMDMKVRLPVLEKHVNADLPVCYKAEINSQREEAIFIQNESICYFWASS